MPSELCVVEYQPRSVDRVVSLPASLAEQLVETESQSIPTQNQQKQNQSTRKGGLWTLEQG